MILFFDTETTGLPKDWKAPMTRVDNWPRIIQFAWKLTDNEGNLIEERKELIKPNGWVVPKEKFWIDNGYSTESNLEKGIEMLEVMNHFISNYDSATLLVAHNMNFDYNIVGAEMIRLNLKASVKLPRACTMKSSTDLCQLPGRGGFGFKFPRLEELHHFLFNEGFDGAHDAMADVNACARCYFELRERGLI